MIEDRPGMGKRRINNGLPAKVSVSKRETWTSFSFTPGFSPVSTFRILRLELR